jgi:uncharacterized membrane protein YeaQ/YmgE (transglycosylase-associated protein family)
MGEIIGLVIAGLVVGALGRLFNPGRDPMGLLMTLAIGVASVLLVGLLLEGPLGFWAYVLAVIVAVILVSVVARVMGGSDDRRLAT